jgi:hypothetical protein
MKPKRKVIDFKTLQKCCYYNSFGARCQFDTKPDKFTCNAKNCPIWKTLPDVEEPK